MSNSRNDLTMEQELHLRHFLNGCANLQIALPARLVGDLLSRMGYKILPNGAAVHKDREVKTIYGDPDPYRNYKDEYHKDGEALKRRYLAEKGKVDAVREEDNNSEVSTPSGPRVEGEGTEER